METRRIQTQQVRGGFTLVEMLVSVALVLLIMSLFAEAFNIAAGSIKKQRGLAENDQRARSLVTIVLGDLQKRTYRQREDAVTAPVQLPVDVNAQPGTQDEVAVYLKNLEDRANKLSLGLVPLHPDYFIGGAPRILAAAPSTATSPGAASRQVADREKGYLHVSEGDPSNDADDVLQFTIDMATTALGNLNTGRLAGRAVMLPGLPTWDTPSDSGINEDQPIWDDGIGWVSDPTTGARRGYVPDEPGTTASQLAEVSMFIRNGNLYRRVNLIREPLDHLDGSGVGEGQPHDGATPVFGNGVNYPPGDFWNDFDHGATRFDAGPFNQIHFHDLASLDNTIGGDMTDGAYPAHPHRFWSLGDPRNRFGFDNTAWAIGGLQGRPKSYLDPGDVTTFIGAWTHEDTSHPEFGFPGLPGHSGGMVSPMRWGPTVAANTFDDGPRQGEDLLLANCHAFDVKVWDDALGSFVDIGHDTPAGDHHERTLDPMEAVQMLVSPNQPGRFQAAQWGMVRFGGVQVDFNPPPPEEPRLNRVFDTWHPAFNFTADERDDSGAMICRPDNDPPPSRPLWHERDNFDAELVDGGSQPTGSTLAPIQFWEPGVEYQAGDRVFPVPNLADGPNDPPMPSHQSFFYIAVEAVPPAGAESGTNQPLWPEYPGARIEDGISGERIVWKAIPNVIGLKAIQITSRFFDPTSGQMRQLTITHSFVEL